MTTIEEIQGRAKEFADARAVLTDRVQELEDELERIKRVRLRGIKTAVATAAACEAGLRGLIEHAPMLFEKPRTAVFHGIKVGYHKGKGGLDWDDDETLVARIEKVYEETAETLLIIKKKPSAKALEELDAAELKKLGVRVEDTGDQVVCKPVDGQVDKLVKALLKGARDEATEE